MSLRTTIYEVDISELKSVTKACPPKLLEKFFAKDRANKIKAGLFIRVVIELDDTFIVNGKTKMTWEKFQAFQQLPESKLKELVWFVRPGKRTGRWRSTDACDDAIFDLLKKTKKSRGMSCRYEWAVWNTWDDEEFTVEAAAYEILRGKIIDGAPKQYGYALEQICKELGKKVLATSSEKGLLSHLNIKSKLNTARDPIRLADRKRKIPMISFLSYQEALAEFEKLSAVAADSTKDKAMFKERARFEKLLQSAVTNQKGLVCFSY